MATRSIFHPLLLLFFLVSLMAGLGSAESNFVKVKVEQMKTEECAYVKTDDSVVKDLETSLTPLFTSGREASSLYIEDTKGNNGSLTFPGCYLFKVKMRTLKPIENPYAEVSIRMGGKVPCRSPDKERESYTESVCRNKTAEPGEWCPKSKNKIVRSISNSDSCRFCNLCHHADNVGRGKKKFLRLLGGEIGDQCRFENNEEPYTLNFQICTPSEDDFESFNKELDGDLENYWDLFKHGSMVLFVHLLERAPNPPSQHQMCDRICEANEKNLDRFGQSLWQEPGYQKMMRSRMSNNCVPEDKYVTCFYTTIKFAIESNFKKK